MRCPFRKDAAREFAPCYGSECMAYMEYSSTPYTIVNGNCVVEPQKYAVCRMMPPIAASYGCV